MAGREQRRLVDRRQLVRGGPVGRRDPRGVAASGIRGGDDERQPLALEPLTRIRNE
jgi:hypothetical protein